MQLYEKIGLMRKIKGWSQEDMAERLGMSVNGYAKIERGETDVQFSRLEKISELLEVSLLELVGLDRSNITISSCLSYHSNFTHIHTLTESGNELMAQKEIEHLKEMLVQKDKEIACLRELLDLLRNPPGRETGG
jgi:transcriptional regulator with XRE-family HTH domain